MNFSYLEIAACLSTLLAIKKNAPMLINVPLPIRVVHFTFVGLFCVIGIDGLKILVCICFHHQEFTDAFSNPNPLGISTSLLEWIGYGFATAGTLLCFASLKLCGLRNWARRIITSLALPYSILFPSIILTATYNSKITHEVEVAQIETVIFAVPAIAAMIFYRSKYVGKYLVFK